MYHVYTERNHSEFSKTFVAQYTDLDEALDCAQKAITKKPDLNYIIEETDGHVDNYGDLVATIVAKN